MDETTITKGQVKLGLGVLVVILFFALCFRIIQPGQVGVVTLLGTVNREVGEGPMLKLPWPLERLHKFDVKTQKDQADAAAASQDLQDVNATIVTNYHIERGKVGELFRSVGLDWKDRLVDPAVQESVKAISAKYAVANIIKSRPEVKEQILSSLKERLGKRGIVVEDVSITNLTFSKEFTAAIEATQVTQQHAELAKFKALEAENLAQADINRAKGQAEAQRLIQQSVTPDVLQKQAIDKWDGKMPQYVGQGSVFGIPVGR